MKKVMIKQRLVFEWSDIKYMTLSMIWKNKKNLYEDLIIPLQCLLGHNYFHFTDGSKVCRRCGEFFGKYR